MMFKKITMLGVMAVLWLFKSKVKRPKLKAFLLVALLYFLMGSLQAQENKAVDVTLKGIQIGQQVPDVLLRGLHNYKDGNGKAVSTARISDFNGKLLILDFFATWCSPCIAMIPKMDSLQREFGDKVAFLSVTYQPEKEVLPFMGRLEKQRGRKFDLPLVTGDVGLAALFPHVSLPHYVWIDGDGVVKAVTGFEQVNEAALRKVLEGGRFNADVKNDVFRAFNPEKSLSSFLAEDKLTKQFYQGVLTGHISGVAGQTYSRAVGETYTLTAANLSLRFLYRIAYSGKDFLKDKMVELAVGDSSGLTSNLKGAAHTAWRKQNTYCYQIKLPLEHRDEALRVMRNDLRVFFPRYEVRVERKLKKCWVLKVVGDTVRLKKTEVKPFIDITPFKIEMRKANLAVLVNRLERYDLQAEWPLFLQEGLNVEVDLLTEGDTRSIIGVNKMLLGYGLAFVSEFKMQDVLVIKDRLKKGLGDEG